MPSSLFTNGWIHVLEDSELVLLLIAARMREPTRRHASTAAVRGAQTELRAERWRLPSRRRTACSTTSEFSTSSPTISATPTARWTASATGAPGPHLLRFHPEALDKPAYPTIVDTIKDQIAKAEGS